MTAAAGIPGVPTAALDAITDENTRMVLRAIVDGWQVRNGNTGTGDNRFVTAGELSASTGYRLVGGMGNVQQPASGNRINPSDISRIISDLQASVMESALWRSLGESIRLVQIDASVNATGLATEVQNRLNADNAIVQSTTTQFAVVNGNVSALQTSQTTTANNVASLTSSVSTLQASVAGNTAAIQQESITRANTDGLLSAQYTVKVDVNGYVSGFGLASTATNSTPFSQFIIRADRFAIGTPSVPDYAQYVNNYADLLAGWYAAGQPDKEIYGYNHWNVYGQYQSRIVPSKIEQISPFTVNTTPQAVYGRIAPPGVYIDNSFIRNGSITTAAIGLAQIDTLTIQGNAVTVPVGLTLFTQTEATGFGSILEIISASITLDFPGWVYASTTAYIGYGFGWRNVETKLFINETQVSAGGGDSAWTNASHSGSLYVPTSGTVTAKLTFTGESGCRIANPTMFLMGVKR